MHVSVWFVLLNPSVKQKPPPDIRSESKEKWLVLGEESRTFSQPGVTDRPKECLFTPVTSHHITYLACSFSKIPSTVVLYAFLVFTVVSFPSTFSSRMNHLCFLDPYCFPSFGLSLTVSYLPELWTQLFSSKHLSLQFSDLCSLCLGTLFGSLLPTSHPTQSCYSVFSYFSLSVMLDLSSIFVHNLSINTNSPLHFIIAHPQVVLD